MNEHVIKPIARIYNDYTSKFAIPRQSGIIESVKSRIVFEPEYRIDEALRGLEDFSYIWLIWAFSENFRENWSPTVRPPKLGGNKRMGVFATRSPFRPNSMGLSSVKLEEIKKSQQSGTYLVVSGADLMNETPIYDIKPYLPYADIHKGAKGGFTDALTDSMLDVDIPEKLLSKLESEKMDVLKKILSSDPRPSYHDDTRVYGFSFANKEVKFMVDGHKLTVLDIE